MDTKARLDKLITQIGVIAVLEVDNEKELRVVIENANSLNTIQIKGRLRGQNSTSLLQEISGNGNEKVNISTYEQVIIECTQLNPDPLGVGVVRIIASSFNLASGSAIEIDVPAGDSLSDVEVLTFTSSDNSVVIIGDNSTKSIDFSVNLNLDDVREYPTLLDFPSVGQSNTLYVAVDTEKIYRFSGSIYIEVSPSPVTSVNSQTGNVVLDKSSIGLSNVDNTSDANKPISTAVQSALNLKQNSLGFTPENIANKSDDPALGTSTSLYPTQKAVKEYVDSAVTAGAPDASATTKGILKLTGDLGGTANLPTVPGLATKYDASNPAGYITVSQAASAAPVQSVNTKTGAVVLDKNDIGLGNVDNTSDLNKPISSATQTAITALSDSFKYNQIVYVDKANTNSYVADGSISKPYKSIKAMYDAIIDASASKRYVCIIAPGTYTEFGTIQLKGWIDLTSAATDTVIIGTVGNVSINWSNNNPGRVFIKDIGFSVNLEILNDDPSGTSGMVLDLDNVDIPSLTFRGRGGGRDFIQLRNDTRISGNCLIQSAATTIFDSTGIGTLTMNDVECVAPDSFGSAITASIRSNYIGAISISATTYDVYTDIWGTIVAGNLTIASNASSYPCYYNYDATSYPLGTVTLTGTNPAQLVRTSKAESIRYTPEVSGNWTAPVPTEVKAALDNLALNKISTSQKGAANGVAPLNASTKIDATYLPSYVDDVEEYANLAAFPGTGETGKIYVAIDTNKIYRWSGSAYIEISPSPAPTWGSITGTLSTQTDLQSALNGKANTSHTQDLSTINQSGASSGQVPTWNGTSWVPQTPSGGGSSISILDEGIQITTSPTSINFTGGGVTASSDLSGNVTVSFSTAGDATTLIVEAYNDTGATIPKMSVVYINGAHGNLPKLSLSLGNAEPTSSKTLGIVRSDISNMNNGFVVATGKLIDLDTDIVGWNEGDSLWLSPSVAGGITNVKPLAPNHAVFVGTLIRKHPTQGIIEVKIQNGFELQELHNVSINGISDGQIIRYENSTSLWKNVTLNSDGVAEGSTNLYFTDTRARTAAVADSIVDGVTNIAPSQNAVFDGLSAKQATLVSGTNIKTINGSSILGSGDLVISGSGAVTSVNGQVGDVVLDKSDVGLGNVDNTADSAKPVSTATQTALDTKENTINKSSDAALGTSNILYPTQNAVKSYVDTGLSGKQNSLGFTPENITNKSTNTSLGTSDTAYPTQNAVKVYVDNAIAGAAGAVTSVNSQIGSVVLTKADIGLSNVDNTSDASKPVSTATQAALNLKADSSALSGKVSTTGDSMTGALSISVASDTALTANTLKLGNLFGGFASVTTSPTSSDSLLLASAFPAANNASSAIYILSGYTDNANTGALLISSGNVGSGNGSSGNVQIGTGTPSGDGSSGNMDFYSANCSGTGSTGYAALRSGIKNGTTGNSGPAVVDSGANNGSGESGFVRLKSGNTVSGNSGQADIATGNVSGAGNSGNIVFTTGTVTGGVRGEIRISAPNLNLQNNSITNTAAFYFGDPNTDGTWRIIPSGSNLVTERRESGVWVTKQTITP